MFANIVTRALIAMLALAASMSVAEAAKLPIPCTSEKIVRVAELPTHIDTGNGHRLGLGYLYTGCFSGKWIGHVGSDEKYNDKVGLLLAAAMTEANNGVAPPEPGLMWGLWNYPWQFFVEWLWLFAVAVIVIEISKNLLRYGTIKNPHNVASLRAAAEARQQHGDSSAASPAKPAAMTTPQVPARAGTAVPPTRRAPRDLQASVAPAFGKRV